MTDCTIGAASPVADASSRVTPAETLEHSSAADGVDTTSRKRKLSADRKVSSARDCCNHRQNFAASERARLSAEQDLLVIREELLKKDEQVFDLVERNKHLMGFERAARGHYEIYLASAERTYGKHAASLQVGNLQDKKKILTLEKEMLDFKTEFDKLSVHHVKLKTDHDKLKTSCSEMETHCNAKVSEMSEEIKQLKAGRDAQGQINNAIIPNPLRSHLTDLRLLTNGYYKHPDAPRHNKIHEPI